MSVRAIERDTPDEAGLSQFGKSHKLSVNVSPEIGHRLRRLAFEQRVSESSIVEIGLRLFFERGEDSSLGEELRQLGASLRRK
ncbi:MAG: hypothetical protein M3007_06515 [Candidatus Eremiobacteraeota bacterium]|nr:hypothetical protein [Candidatus Eremiobacteraeota bacterium]